MVGVEKVKKKFKFIQLSSRKLEPIPWTKNYILGYEPRAAGKPEVWKRKHREADEEGKVCVNRAKIVFYSSLHTHSLRPTAHYYPRYYYPLL